MCRLGTTILLVFFIAESSHAVNIRPCEDIPEVRDFASKLAEARHCESDNDCIVHDFRGSDNRYGPGNPVNKRELESLIRLDEALPECSWGLCECLYRELKKVTCEENICTVHFENLHITNH
jgi:hypothetical protein